MPGAFGLWACVARRMARCLARIAGLVVGFIHVLWGHGWAALGGGTVGLVGLGAGVLPLHGAFGVGSHRGLDGGCGYSIGWRRPEGMSRLVFCMGPSTPMRAAPICGQSISTHGGEISARLRPLPG